MAEQTNPNTDPVTPFHYTDSETGLTYSGTITNTGDGQVVVLNDGEFIEDVEDAESEDGEA